MPGFPIGSDDITPQFSGSSGAPYSEAEVQDYLAGCHWQFETSEDGATVTAQVLLDMRTLTNRRFWLWQVDYENGARWLVIAGSGLSPFVHDTRDLGRWIYAKKDEGTYSPKEFFDYEIAQHP